MMDRKTIIKALECCLQSDVSGLCPDECPFADADETENRCFEQVKQLVLGLLKEQPEIVRCGDCEFWDGGHTEECDNLASICFHNGWCKPEWFCANGMKRRNEDV